MQKFENTNLNLLIALFFISYQIWKFCFRCGKKFLPHLQLRYVHLTLTHSVEQSFLYMVQSHRRFGLNLILQNCNCKLSSKKWLHQFATIAIQCFLLVSIVFHSYSWRWKLPSGHQVLDKRQRIMSLGMQQSIPKIHLRGIIVLSERIPQWTA